MIGDLSEHGPIARWINPPRQNLVLRRRRHARSSTRLHKTTVEATDRRRSDVTEDHRYSVSVAGVIVDDQGRALLVQRRDNGHWEPPGGILEHGETIEDCLRREVFEETGLNVEPAQLTGVYQNLSRSIVALVFRCRLLSGTGTKNEEVKAMRWVDGAEVQTLVVQAYAVRVLDALERDGAPRIRYHDGTNLIRNTRRRLPA
jgi:ADP-ribose pyrophosphatase YjhB (NUDIX family)